MKRYLVLTISFILFISFEIPAQINIADKFQYRSHMYKGMTIPFRLFVPENYNSSQKYPLVLALHGSGERGTDNKAHVNNYRLATVWADSVNQVKYPCFVVAPQCPPGGSWFTSFPVDRFPLAQETEVVIDILASLANEFNVDENRSVSSSNIFPAHPVNFTIHNTTSGEPVNFVYTSSGTITKTHNIWLLEELNGKKKRTWRISIIDNEVNRTIPFGDTLYLYTYKGLSIYDSIKILSGIVSVKNEYIPGNLYLSQNYPNPFNPVTEIRFGVEQPGKVSLEIFNSLGQRVHTLVNKHMDKGEYHISYNASELASGIYLYRLESKGRVITKKMLLLK